MRLAGMQLVGTMCAGALLALAGCAAAPVQDVAAVEISGEEIRNYWTPKTDTIRRRLDTSTLRTRAGDLRPMAHRVTVTYLIDANGEVRDARVIEVEPADASAQWALTAVSAFSYAPTDSNPGRTPVRPTHTLTLGKAPPASP